MDALECKTSAMSFCSKLRRFTNNARPSEVPVSPLDWPCDASSHFFSSQDRYRVLLRVSRQWRDLKARKEFGLAFTNGESKLGQLAWFCPACPQPGINLPDDWEEDPEECVHVTIKSSQFILKSSNYRWVYRRTVVVDGNFSADHQKMKNPEDDVPLTDGEGYMVQEGPFRQHLMDTPEIPAVRQYYSGPSEMPTHYIQRTGGCRKHRAVINANNRKKNLDATGIAACACGRHGFFVPHSVVDFQKGERCAL
jgi:hypothetical protein